VKPAETAVARQWLNRRHVIAAKDKYATIKDLMETVVSVKSVPSLCNKDQLPSRKNVQAVSRFELGWLSPGAVRGPRGRGRLAVRFGARSWFPAGKAVGVCN
jgi:hypothetical protein